MTGADETQAMPAPPRPATGYSPFVPGLLIALTVLAWVGYQTLQLSVTRTNLHNAISGQQDQMDQAKKLRDGLESLATRLGRAAQAGNANATVIIDELRKRGISVNPNPVPESPAPAAAPAPAP